MNSTADNDGSIESAIAQLIQPEEPEQETETLEAEEVEAEEYQSDEGEHEEDDEPETSEEEDDEDESEPDDEEDDEDDEEAEEASKPDFITVTVDGNETQVTLDELKRGYAGQQSITQRFQELSAQRKEVEQVYGNLMQAQNAVTSLLNNIQNEGIPIEPSEPPRELFQTDPVRYVEEKQRYDAEKAVYDQRIAEMQQVREQQAQAQEMARRAHMHRELDALMATVPEFRDPKSEEAVQARDKMLSIGAEVYGYSQEELGQVMDHRAYRVLLDAAKYQEIVRGKEKATQKAKPKNRKPIKPGAKKAAKHSKTQREKQLRSNLKRSGRIEDAIDLLIQP